MRNRLNIVVLGSLLASLILVTVAAASGPVHWSYEGEAGPEHWGELSHDFAACSEGKEQSPIDVPGTATVNPADLTFNYQPTAVNILNNGHTIQVNYDVGSSLEVDGTTYNLLQLHFHATSEHTVGGKYSDMEMHLVHQSADGGYAVVGVMINRGAENAAFAPVWNNLPAEEAEAQTVGGASVNASDLLPADPTYFRYNGSFTTPPCTEGVKWFLMSNPVELSDAQIASFEQIYDGNFRPVQPFNDRSFLVTSEVAAAPTALPTTGTNRTDQLSLVLILAGIAALGVGLVGYTTRRQSA